MLVSIGEVVWDIFGDKRVLGGAPVNVAYHLRSLGMEVQVVSRVGPDELGEITLERVAALGLPVNGIQRDKRFPTGRVVVTVAPDNEPHFDIIDPAAWDYIESDEALRVAGEEPFYLIYGTLAQRRDVSRTAIRALWDLAAVRFYDVNLRPPFTTKELVMESLAVADVVKVNDDEIAKLAGWLDMAYKDKVKTADAMLKKYDLKAVVVTEGKAGSWVLGSDGFFQHPGFTVTVDDTVGAGDAFFATLTEGYIHQRSWSDCLARANHRGAYVASQSGATPPMEGYKYNASGF